MQGDSIEATKAFLRDLYAGPVQRHAISMMPPMPPNPLGDFTLSTRPVCEWVPYYTRLVEDMATYRDVLGLDLIPFVNLNTNTGIFAAAFGCPLHKNPDDDLPAFALPAIGDAAEADALPEPGMDAAAALMRTLELGERMRECLGPDVPVGVPDVQSPFDVAALVWRKEDFFAALVETPDPAFRLIEKCHRLIESFLDRFLERFPNANLSHCPVTAWAPPELGCWLSEDEAGAISPGMFEAFALPSLVELSNHFGGMFLHCCAAADHQYANFARIPDLRGLNRVFQYPPGPGPALERFSGQSVFIQAWLNEQEAGAFLDQVRTDTRFFFELQPLPLEDAKPVVERLRMACERARERVAGTP